MASTSTSASAAPTPQMRTKSTQKTEHFDANKLHKRVAHRIQFQRNPLPLIFLESALSRGTQGCLQSGCRPRRWLAPQWKATRRTARTAAHSPKRSALPGARPRLVPSRSRSTNRLDRQPSWDPNRSVDPRQWPAPQLAHWNQPHECRRQRPRHRALDRHFCGFRPGESPQRRRAQQFPAASSKSATHQPRQSGVVRRPANRLAIAQRRWHGGIPCKP